jgi:hypothetical protein
VGEALRGFFWPDDLKSRTCNLEEAFQLELIAAFRFFPEQETNSSFVSTQCNKPNENHENYTSFAMQQPSTASVDFRQRIFNRPGPKQSDATRRAGADYEDLVPD